MTREEREEAIADMRKLKAEYMNGRKLDAITERKCKSFDMAIKALEEPALDNIRAEIADEKENAEITFGHPLGFDRIAAYDKCLKIIDKYRPMRS